MYVCAQYEIREMDTLNAIQDTVQTPFANTIRMKIAVNSAHLPQVSASGHRLKLNHLTLKGSPDDSLGACLRFVNTGAAEIETVGDGDDVASQSVNEANALTVSGISSV